MFILGEVTDTPNMITRAFSEDVMDVIGPKFSNAGVMTKAGALRKPLYCLFNWH